MSSFLNLEGSRVLITGASSGIGRQTAILASRQGARVAVVARRADALEDLIQQLEGTGHIALPFDLTDLDGIDGLVDSVRARLDGPIDGLVHAAGAHLALPLRSSTVASVRDMFDINVVSAAMLAKAFRRRQVRGPNASIVLLSSAVGLVGQAGVSAYSASKGAIVSLTKSLALELARENIRVNCLCPGVVETDMTSTIRDRVGATAFERIVEAHPLGLGQPEDVANSVLYLLSSASRWVTGSALVVDGGYTAQ